MNEEFLNSKLREHEWNSEDYSLLLRVRPRIGHGLPFSCCATVAVIHRPAPQMRYTVFPKKTLPSL